MANLHFCLVNTEFSESTGWLYFTYLERFLVQLRTKNCSWRVRVLCRGSSEIIIKKENDQIKHDLHLNIVSFIYLFMSLNITV